MEKRKRGGQAKPEEFKKSRNVTFRVTRSLHEKLSQEAAERGQSIGSLIASRLEQSSTCEQLAELVRQAVRDELRQSSP